MVMVMDTGDRANASSEIEYRGAWGHLIGGKVRSMTTPFSSILSMNLRCMHVCMYVFCAEEGKGVRTIIEMVQSTRCVR